MRQNSAAVRALYEQCMTRNELACLTNERRVAIQVMPGEAGHGE